MSNKFLSKKKYLLSRTGKKNKAFTHPSVLRVEVRAADRTDAVPALSAPSKIGEIRWFSDRAKIDFYDLLLQSEKRSSYSLGKLNFWLQLEQPDRTTLK